MGGEAGGQACGRWAATVNTCSPRNGQLRWLSVVSTSAINSPGNPRVEITHLRCSANDHHGGMSDVDGRVGDGARNSRQLRTYPQTSVRNTDGLRRTKSSGDIQSVAGGGLQRRTAQWRIGAFGGKNTDWRGRQISGRAYASERRDGSCRGQLKTVNLVEPPWRKPPVANGSATKPPP